jgi:hypothetical protein
MNLRALGRPRQGAILTMITKLQLPLKPQTVSPSISIADLVAISCRVSRVSSVSRHENRWESDREGKLLTCPWIGTSMWLVIDDVRWLRTTPVVDLKLIEHTRSVQVVVVTEGTRYRLEFDREVIERVNRRERG